MLKVLKQAYVPYNAPIDKIDRLVGNIMMDNYISFSDDEIPSNGRGSTKALQITTKVTDCTLPKVLIDNGSSLKWVLFERHVVVYFDEATSGQILYEAHQDCGESF